MARGDSLSRQLQLWMLLDSERALSVDDVCSRLSINRRTLYRDLDVLQRCGMPLYQEQQGRRVRWRLDDGFRRKLSVQLSVQEVMAIVAAEKLLSSMGGTVFATAASTAVDKLKAQLAAPIRNRLTRLTSSFTASAGSSRDLSTHTEHLDAFLKAVEGNEVITVRYQKLGAGTPEKYTLEPHHVHVHGNSVYVVAWALERQAPRIFLLDRVRSVAATGRFFVRRAELPVGVFEQGAFGLWEGKPTLVRLRFKGTAVRIVSEQRLHPSQKTFRGVGGTLDVELMVPKSPPLIAWVLGFGDRVEVLQPKDLLS
jgi:predicted DNA-binding transcriptional regulator YafY